MKKRKKATQRRQRLLQSLTDEAMIELNSERKNRRQKNPTRNQDKSLTSIIQFDETNRTAHKLAPSNVTFFSKSFNSEVDFLFFTVILLTNFLLKISYINDGCLAVRSWRYDREDTRLKLLKKTFREHTHKNTRARRRFQSTFLTSQTRFFLFPSIFKCNLR